MTCSEFRTFFGRTRWEDTTRGERLALVNHLRACGACSEFAHVMAQRALTWMPPEQVARECQQTTALAQSDKKDPEFVEGLR